MEQPLRPIPAPSRIARHFNLVVALLAFILMLGFGGWSTLAGLRDGAPLRTASGAVIAAAALILLRAVLDDWRAGAPFQQSLTMRLGFARFGVGTTLLPAG